MSKKKSKGYFSDIAIGHSEFEAILQARKWENYFPDRYRVKNIKLIRKPGFIEKILFFGCEYHVVSYDVEILK